MSLMGTTLYSCWGEKQARRPISKGKLIHCIHLRSMYHVHTHITNTSPKSQKYLKLRATLQPFMIKTKKINYLTAAYNCNQMCNLYYKLYKSILSMEKWVGNQYRNMEFNRDIDKKVVKCTVYYWNIKNYI